MDYKEENGMLQGWVSYREELARKRAQSEEEQAAKEAGRLAAVERGEHLTWLEKAKKHLAQGEYRAAKNCAREGLRLMELPQLTYVMALACNALDEKNEAEVHALGCMQQGNKKGLFPEGSEERVTLCKILIRCGSYYDGGPWVVALWEKGLISTLEKEESKKACEAVLQRYYGADCGFDEALEEEKRENIYALLLYLIETHLSDPGEGYPNGSQMSNRAKCKAVCMMVQRGEHLRARAIADTIDTSEVMTSTEDPTILIFLGECHFETGDPATARMYWQGHRERVVFPLDLLISMGYGEDYLKCLPQKQLEEGREKVSRTEDFLKGKFPASVYFKEYPGYDYLYRAGINDYIWTYDRDSDTWGTVPHDPFR